MSKINFKNTILKEQKEKEKSRKRKFIRLRELVRELKESIKPGQENEQRFFELIEAISKYKIVG